MKLITILRRLCMTFRKVEKILIANGWFLNRMLGTHCQYCNMNVKNSIIVPNYGEQDLSISFIKNLEKNTGLFFQE